MPYTEEREDWLPHTVDLVFLAARFSQVDVISIAKFIIIKFNIYTKQISTYKNVYADKHTDTANGA